MLELSTDKLKKIQKEYPNFNINQSEKEQKIVIEDFNKILEEYRKKYHSLFLTNYRNSTSSYARKRISFDVAYKTLSYVIFKNKIKH